MTSSDLAIRAEGISKLYRIGAKYEKYKTLRDTLASAGRRPYERIRSAWVGQRKERTDGTLWALKDVSFEVRRGEVVGIIGRNGAGKSTLLKVLSRITEPTAGYAEIMGRVGSLLEVGTGFHPELTGRENIYLNGAILGMKRREIKDRFDAIVDFAEVEKFIDTPVKHFSSGMYLRLAFAVAAHLDPQILLVDEVLAVGDAQFQSKCLGKMGDVVHEGRTVLFVSHNMSAVQQLCERCLLVADGRIRVQGETQSVISQYMGSLQTTENSTVDTGQIRARSGTGEGRITRVGIRDEFEMPTNSIGIGHPFSILIQLELPPGAPSLVIGVEVKRSDGFPVVNMRSDSQGVVFEPTREQEIPTIREIEVRVPGIPLYPGRYVVEPWFCWHKGKRVDQVHDAVLLDLVSCGMFSSERMLQPGRGLVFVDPCWVDIGT